MEALMNWTRWFGIKLFKNNNIKERQTKLKPNGALYLEQLSPRLKKDLGLNYESNDSSDYKKYL
ncbi:hypothetical protein AB6D66_19270 [Vibrio pomeroyi]|uniref:Uncharacterized protein n=1 Tax=Vibrio pomeroyi TaxID=198832 RepID=A0ABV4N114_9VIBR